MITFDNIGYNLKLLHLIIYVIIDFMVTCLIKSYLFTLSHYSCDGCCTIRPIYPVVHLLTHKKPRKPSARILEIRNEYLPNTMASICGAFNRHLPQARLPPLRVPAQLNCNRNSDPAYVIKLVRETCLPFVLTRTLLLCKVEFLLVTY
jgi:hypothetical protein